MLYYITIEAEGEDPAINFIFLIVPRRYFCDGSYCFMSWCLFFVLLAPYVYMFRMMCNVLVTEWPPIGKIAAHMLYVFLVLVPDC